MGISRAIRVFESPYYVFDNLSVLSIYSEVLALAHLAINSMVLNETAHDKSMKSKLKIIQLKSSTSLVYVCNPFLMFKKENIFFYLLITEVREHSITRWTR